MIFTRFFHREQHQDVFIFIFYSSTSSSAEKSSLRMRFTRQSVSNCQAQSTLPVFATKVQVQFPEAHEKTRRLEPFKGYLQKGCISHWDLLKSSCNLTDLSKVNLSY